MILNSMIEYFKFILFIKIIELVLIVVLKVLNIGRGLIGWGVGMEVLGFFVKIKEEEWLIEISW